MKLGKAFLVALILVAFPVVGFGQRETASKDGNGVRGLLLHDAANLQTRRWLDDGLGGALVSFSVGASSLADQGISGVSDVDPWNVMIRSGAGTELGLAASPFAISIFDAASNLLGVTANPFVVDLGINNDVTVTSGSITVDNASGASAVNIQDGGNVISVDDGGSTLSIDDGAGSITVDGTVTADAGTGTFNMQATAALPGSVRLSDGSVFYKATTPSDTQPISAASLPLPAGAATQTTLADVELNTDTAQTASEPVVIVIGITPTLIFAASSTTRRVTIQNTGTEIVFLGKSGVAATTGIGIRGGVVDDDMKGQTAVAKHSDDIYGIVLAGTETVRVQKVSD